MSFKDMAAKILGESVEKKDVKEIVEEVVINEVRSFSGGNRNKRPKAKRRIHSWRRLGKQSKVDCIRTAIADII